MERNNEFPNVIMIKERDQNIYKMIGLIIIGSLVTVFIILAIAASCAANKQDHEL